jgi:Rieske Fe-S protein
VLKQKDYRKWVAIGDATEFQPGQTKLVNFRNPYTESWDGVTANVPAYVRCTGPVTETGSFVVFAVNCAHLGCPVRWFSESQLFMCPCHGGVYYADGSRASGPPERGLFTYDAKIENGQLMIDAGQMPTLSNRASVESCPGASAKKEDSLVQIT